MIVGGRQVDGEAGLPVGSLWTVMVPWWAWTMAWVMAGVGAGAVGDAAVGVRGDLGLPLEDPVELVGGPDRRLAGRGKPADVTQKIWSPETRHSYPPWVTFLA